MLHDTTTQIQDTVHNMCDAAGGLATEESSFNALIRETLRELGLTLDGDGFWNQSCSSRAEEVHESTQASIRAGTSADSHR